MCRRHPLPSPAGLLSPQPYPGAKDSGCSVLLQPCSGFVFGCVPLDISQKGFLLFLGEKFLTKKSFCVGSNKRNFFRLSYREVILAYT